MKCISGRFYRDFRCFCKISGSKWAGKAVRKKLQIIGARFNSYFVEKPDRYPVIAMGTFFSVFAPAVQKTVFFHIHKRKNKAESFICQIAFDPVKFRKSPIGISC